MLILLTVSSQLKAGNYEDAWKALANNDRKQAETLFLKAMNEPEHTVDAATCLIYLQGFKKEDEETPTEYWQKIAQKAADVNPYAFAMWFRDGVMGDYGIKRAQQEKNIKQVMDDARFNGTLKASAKYQMGHHYFCKRDFVKMKNSWAIASNVNNWQFVGPFDNVSESGFDKNYLPIQNPEESASFLSTLNYPIKWFTPAAQMDDGWVTPSHNIRNTTAILYGQTFVTVAEDKEVYIGVGFTGNIKVWVNDKLMLQVPEMLKTDFDIFKFPCKLNKGANRILVQLGFEDEEYANYSLRIIDEKGNMLPGIESAHSYKPYTKDLSNTKVTQIPFFAETYFMQKIKEEPENLVNYLLLTKTYSRSKKNQEALKVILEALKKSPRNSFLRIAAIECYIALGERVPLLEQVEALKKDDPDCLFTQILLFDEAYENEKYDEASKILNKRIAAYGEDPDVLKCQVKLAASQKEIEKMLSIVEAGYKKYPDNLFFVDMKVDVALKLNKNTTEALNLYEQYIYRVFNMKIYKKLGNSYIELGQAERGLSYLVKAAELFPNDPVGEIELFNYYYAKKMNKKAEASINKVLGLAPYSSRYWSMAAMLSKQMGENEKAIEQMQQALQYNPNDFDARKSIRLLSDKDDVATYLPETNVYNLIETNRYEDKKGKYDWYYIANTQATVIYPEKSAETYYTIAVRVLNDKGIDEWKEKQISYNQRRQRLIIEKAEVVKANGSTSRAEINETELVFTNLEKGDVVHVKYKIINYIGSRLSREYWDQSFLNSNVPIDFQSISILVSKKVPLYYTVYNTDIKPVQRERDEFMLYTWELKNEPAIKEENFSPSWSDMCKVLHVSTVKTWKEIAEWYSDASGIQAKSDYLVKEVVQNLFPKGAAAVSERERAQAIYRYIQDNISYSSVPFRQGALIPQRASKVIQSRLGDCKDMATLYAALAREAGLSANLVLLNTHDNGSNDLILPSLDFNHCIVSVMVDGKKMFLELTQPYLPFGYVSDYDMEAAALEIPYVFSATDNPELFKLPAQNYKPNIRAYTSEVEVQGRNLNFTTHAHLKGSISAKYHDRFIDKTEKDIKDDFQESVSKISSNPVTIQSVEVVPNDKLEDNLAFAIKYNIKNEVIQIGELNMVKPVFYFIYLGSSVFPEDTRTHTLMYSEYEDTEVFADSIHINVPSGKQFTEIPKDIELTYKNTKYKLSYAKAEDGSVWVYRNINVDRRDISPEDYKAFKEFLENVLSAEGRYIGFK